MCSRSPSQRGKRPPVGRLRPTRAGSGLRAVAELAFPGQRRLLFAAEPFEIDLEIPELDQVEPDGAKVHPDGANAAQTGLANTTQIDRANTAYKDRANTQVRPYHAVFIRAPLIEAVQPPAQILAQLPDGRIVAARQGRLLATSFHPELTVDERFHRYFVDFAK